MSVKIASWVQHLRGPIRFCFLLIRLVLYRGTYREQLCIDMSSSVLFQIRFEIPEMKKKDKKKPRVEQEVVMEGDDDVRVGDATNMSHFFTGLSIVEIGD